MRAAIIATIVCSIQALAAPAPIIQDLEERYDCSAGPLATSTFFNATHWWVANTPYFGTQSNTDPSQYNSCGYYYKPQLDKFGRTIARTFYPNGTPYNANYQG